MAKISLYDLNNKKKSGEPITWITSYDFPLAFAAEKAGVDMILVGDSGGMVQLGYQTTNPVTMDEMIVLAKATRRGAPNTFIVGDMPQGSYEVSEEEAIKNALRFVKEAGCDAIKLEGGERVANKIKAIVDAGILVFGHLGLTPQSAASFGGYRVQGKTVDSFESTLKDAKILEEAGVCGLLLEAMPVEPSEQIAKALKVPVLGIGAGHKVDGQLIIIHDMLGLYPSFRPKFAKCYIEELLPAFQDYLKSFDKTKSKTGDGLLAYTELAIKAYVKETKDRKFPSEQFNYPITKEELQKLSESKFWRK